MRTTLQIKIADVSLRLECVEKLAKARERGGGRRDCRLVIGSDMKLFHTDFSLFFVLESSSVHL